MSGPKTISVDYEYLEQQRREAERKALDDWKRYVKATIASERNRLQREYNERIKEIASLKSRLESLLSKTDVKFEILGVTYDMKEYTEEIKEMLRRIKKAETMIADDYTLGIKELDRFEEFARDVSDISRVKNPPAPTISVVPTINIGKKEKEITEKRRRIEQYAKIVNSFASTLKGDNTRFVDRLKNLLKSSDPFSAEGLKELEKIVNDIKEEIKVIEERLASAKKGDESFEYTREYETSLRILLSSLSTFTGDLTRYQETMLEIKDENVIVYDECVEKIRNILKDDSIAPHDKKLLKALEDELRYLKGSINTPGGDEKLNAMMNKINALINAANNNKELYKKFLILKKRYEDIYSRYTKEELKIIFLEKTLLKNPASIVFGENEYQNISIIKTLEELIDVYDEHSESRLLLHFVDNYVKALGKNFLFKEEKEDGYQIAFVHPGDKDVIFIVEITKDRKVTIYPRIVVLRNGKRLTSEEELRRTYSSCGWSKELVDALRSGGFNVKDAEELGEEVNEKMFLEENFYHFSSNVMAAEFLRKLGYNDFQIAELLKSEDGEAKEEIEEEIVEEGELIRKEIK